MVFRSNVTVLRREGGYTMKYCLSPRDFLRAQAIFHRIPQLESQYSHSQLPNNVMFPINLVLVPIKLIFIGTCTRCSNLYELGTFLRWWCLRCWWCRWQWRWWCWWLWWCWWCWCWHHKLQLDRYYVINYHCGSHETHKTCRSIETV